MGWAALGKAAMGAVKGKAKQIATDKLLNRKKKTDARRASAQKMMGQDSGGGEEKGGAIVKAQISPMPLAKSTEHWENSCCRWRRRWIRTNTRNFIKN